MRIRTLLADRGELALIGLRAILGGESRIEIVGAARNVEDMLAQITQHRPHVVMIDHTAEGFGAESIREGTKRYKRTRFVAITPDPSQLALMSALRAGVTSYIKKDCDPQEIVDSVISTGEGRKFFCGKILRAIQGSAIDVAGLGEEATCTPVTISDREAEIISLIAEGCSYTGIADRLCLSAHTVTTHRKNIMQKLGVNNTASLVVYAVKNGLVSPNKFLFNA
ncbi:MAG: response regulator transcription factor [Flavobacteriales bacterium]|jgi:DNA-binding NarL/FixJ family response regulator|nr:response regulator transcription factor [Flavobacteriales bacterium]MBP9160840.1 response regulator transcription factor [Flavobacteriales bacterium]MCI1754261.1 response regulator transcription factor [Flavobacteriales bacterium]